MASATAIDTLRESTRTPYAELPEGHDTRTDPVWSDKTMLGTIKDTRCVRPVVSCRPAYLMPGCDHTLQRVLRREGDVRSSRSGA